MPKNAVAEKGKKEYSKAVDIGTPPSVHQVSEFLLGLKKNNIDESVEE